MSKENSSDQYINTLIGEDSRITGDINVGGLLRIDGDLLGTATTEKRILVGTKGRIKGSLFGSQVVIGGVVKGDVTAREKVVLLSSCLVIGNVFSPKLIVEDGAIVEGYCSVHETLPDQPSQNYPGMATFRLVIPTRKETVAESAGIGPT